MLRMQMQNTMKQWTMNTWINDGIENTRNEHNWNRERNGETMHLNYAGSRAACERACNLNRLWIYCGRPTRSNDEMEKRFIGIHNRSIAGLISFASKRKSYARCEVSVSECVWCPVGIVSSGQLFNVYVCASDTEIGKTIKIHMNWRGCFDAQFWSRITLWNF